MNPEKAFKYDVLINAEDLCDREFEQQDFLKRAKAKKRTIVFAPRRYGKTSLIKNVVGNSFFNLSRNHLVLFFDLMDVQSMESIAKRLHHGITQALSRRFPVKTLLKNATDYLKGFSLQMDMDPVTGQPSLSMNVKGREVENEMTHLMAAIKTLSQKYPTLIILDEFHDITFVPEAEALFRGVLQELGESAVFILGSKRHLLTLMFQDARAPLFQYGDEIHLNPIALEDWLDYFRERMTPNKIIIGEEELKWILETLCDVPNAICEFGAWLLDNIPSGMTLSVGVIKQSLDLMVENKQSYAYMLQGYTEKELDLMTVIAKNKFTLEPHAESFLKLIRVSKSTVGKIVKKFMDRGLIEYELEKGYRLSDPLMGHYLATR
ncbi:MAG: hypothetical protein IPJ69_08310 [Deltaproteobacteria bacterium]|nr:MAG: hypothetical protein IPJ69_08310 [Deltaproteobacteria bacterium]